MYFVFIPLVQRETILRKHIFTNKVSFVITPLASFFRQLHKVFGKDHLYIFCLNIQTGYRNEIKHKIELRMCTLLLCPRSPPLVRYNAASAERVFRSRRRRILQAVLETCVTSSKYCFRVSSHRDKPNTHTVILT